MLWLDSWEGVPWLLSPCTPQSSKSPGPSERGRRRTTIGVDRSCYFFGSQAVVVWKQPQNSIENEVVQFKYENERKLKESILCCLFENSAYMTWNCDSSKVVSKKGNDMSNHMVRRWADDAFREASWSGGKRPQMIWVEYGDGMYNGLYGKTLKTTVFGIPGYTYICVYWDATPRNSAK